MGFNWPRFREDLKWRRQRGIDNWKALDTGQKWLLGGAIVGVAALSLSLAAYFSFKKPSSVGAITAAGGEVVLYTSVDDFIVRPIVEQFERESGVKVLLVTDTEATKTTGLVERLRTEREAPRADVWWSSESLGTQLLSRDGILEPFIPRATSEFQQGWPGGLKAEDGTWYGFAQRARVIVYSTNRFSKTTAPKTLRDLGDSANIGRVGIARPQFGTTRTHLAYLIASEGEDAARLWLANLVGNGVKIYDGNASVVRAVAYGEIDLGLTDTDDVLAGKANSWPIEMAFEVADRPNARVNGLPSKGTLVIPNTVAKVRGGPNPNQSTRLINFILSAPTERALAQSTSGNIPIREALAKELKMTPIPTVAPVDSKALIDALPKADALANEFFPIVK